MGHRFSKSASTSSNGSNNNSAKALKSNTTNTAEAKSNRVSVPPLAARPTINLQIQETGGSSSQSTTAQQLSNSLASSSTTCPRQIIIKIQLAKMENGLEQHQQQVQDTLAADCGNTDANLNQLESNAQILNLTLNRNFMCGEFASSGSGELITTTATTSRTAGSFAPSTSTSAMLSNNNFSRGNVSGTNNTLMGRINSLQLNDDLEQSTTESAEYCEVLEEASSQEKVEASATVELLEGSEDHLCIEDTDNNNCCRRSKSKSSFGPYTSSKRRCCKCTCRDAFRRILEPSLKSNRSKERKETKQHSHNTEQISVWSPSPPMLPQRSQRNCNSLPSTSSTTSNNSTPISIAAAANSATLTATANQFSIWTPSSSGGGSDVIIPINSPQFVVVQCPPTSLVTLGRIDDNAIRVMTTEIVGTESSVNVHSSAMQQPQNLLVKSGGGASNGPIVHSQVDFVHCLVPDLERITKSSFYWGKMDRYEAERLLDGKPEGTFLLRDSAQEEFLFSVTFRKYGRSLHARIEQSGHKFSFDCHDPCVFTAPTVTGLLEHYKDPACVMFFEPMLTIPLHRKSTFSLQQLCRSTIVSHTTYDGITQMELPARLKSYLKEYHYKQKLRVKPFDEPFYSCT